MKQTFDLVTFEIRDGEYSYNDFAIYKKETRSMEGSEIIKDVYGQDFECEYREVIVYSIQEITKEEVDILQKLNVAF
tara:strand:- start:69 stop:299 length:231 start_codon:yes stop_codon:yes gene_type:complete